MRIRLGVAGLLVTAVVVPVSVSVVVPAASAATWSDTTATGVAGPGYWRHYRREARKLRDRRLARCHTQRCRDRAWDAYRKAMLFATPLAPSYGGGPHLPDLEPRP